MFYIISLICGLLIAVQLVLNGFLSQEHGLFLSTVIIHALALLLISVIILIKRERPFSNRRSWYLYLGGAIGVVTIFFSNIAFAHIGVSAILALSLLGQSLAGLFIDQYGWLGMPKQKFKKHRTIGLLFVLGGITTMIDSFEMLAVILAFLAGFIVIIARTLNAKLAELTTIRISAFFNFLISLFVAVVALVLFGRNEVFSFQVVISSEAYIYFGGFVGISIILIINIIVRKIPGFYLSLLLFIGQVFTGILLDALIDCAFTPNILLGGLLVTTGLCVDLLLVKKRKL